MWPFGPLVLLVSLYSLFLVSLYDTLSNDVMVDYLMTLTVVFILKNSYYGLCYRWCIRVLQTHPGNTLRHQAEISQHESNL